MLEKIKNRGFTLIELLVVIAIIGILASVVLASLNQARSKGQDANIQASINNARAQAELYYDREGGRNYTGLCADSSLDNIKAGVISAGGVWDCEDTISPQAYRISSTLVTDANLHYCVDSTGYAGTSSSTPGGTC